MKHFSNASCHDFGVVLQGRYFEKNCVQNILTPSRRDSTTLSCDVFKHSHPQSVGQGTTLEGLYVVTRPHVVRRKTTKSLYTKDIYNCCTR